MQVTIPETRVPDMTMAQTFQAITFTIGSLKGLRAEQTMPGTLRIVHRRTPGWAIALAIIGLLVFLLGLLFLLVKEEEVTMVSGRDDQEHGGCVLVASGQGPAAVVLALNEFLKPEHQLQPGLPRTSV
jgi:hypothetical protein